MVSTQTSRQRIMDAIELATNQIQLASHLQELIDFDYSDLEVEEDDDKRTKILEKIQKNKLLLDWAVWMRRDTMSYIQDKIENLGQDYWCAFKHALWARWYAQEVYYATRDDKSEQLYKRAKELLMMVLSQFLWLELSKCWRCIEDSLQSKK